MASADKKQFLLQINVTRDCNLRCTHCYISTDKKNASKYMTEDQFLKTFADLADFFKTPKGREYDVADIHVIGGEPTMLGVEFYQKTLPKVREILDSMEQEYVLGLVTNLITEDALNIARMFDSVATSYEEETRFVSWSGKPKPALERKWVNNLRTLQDEGQEISATMAVTKQACDKGAKPILDKFYENGIRKMHMGFFIPSGDGLVYMDTIFPMFEETTQFMIDAMDWYLERRVDDPELYLNPCESMIESMYHQVPMEDIVCPIIPGSLDVDWNGETVTCIQAGGEVWAESLGNVFKTSISDVINGRKYIRERAKAIQPKPGCFGCDEMASCQSACGVLHAYWNGEGECPGFKGFIKYVRHQVENEKIIPKSLFK